MAGDGGTGQHKAVDAASSKADAHRPGPTSPIRASAAATRDPTVINLAPAPRPPANIPHKNAGRLCDATSQPFWLSNAN